MGVAGGAGSPPSVYRQSASLASPHVASLVFVYVQRFLGLLLLHFHVELVRVHLLVSAPGRGCWCLVLVISSVLYSAGPSLTVSYPPCSTLTQTQSLFAGRGQTQLIGGPRQP